MGDRAMDVHSPVNYSVIGKRIWNILRIAFFMVRKGFISKRKLLMDMNLMMKRGKLLGKTLGNLIFHHSYPYPHPPPCGSGSSHGGLGFGLQEYEFSCSNSPNPLFFNVAKRKHHYLNFPCINHPPVDEESNDAHKEDMRNMAILVSPNNNKNQLPHLSPEPCHPYGFQLEAPTLDQLAPGESLSPLLLSPFSVRISNYSEEEVEDESQPNSRVDHDAEEFIRKFYEQLRVQSRTQLLQYQQEMLCRRN